MPCYRVRWPNGEVEIVFAEDDADLFETLDEEGSPYDAIIEEVELPNGLRISEKNWKKTMVEILTEAKVIRELTKEDLDIAFDRLYGGNPVLTIQ